MIIITKQKEFHIEDKTAVAIGKFDGVHKGHQRLLDEIFKAKSNGFKTVIFTFDPPVEELFKEGEFKYLSTNIEKRRIFEKLGIDYLVEFPMDRETASIMPEEFVHKYICQYMNASLVVCGDDLSFGKEGKGDFKLLEKMSLECGFKAVSIDKIHSMINGADIVICSSIIRELICTSKMEEAANLLGDSYSICGEVVHGKQLGRTMGVPTVNLDIDSKKLMPPFGVYYSNVVFDNKVYKSITNIGTKPTIKDDKTVNAESFIYDFDGNLYGKTIEVKLLKFKRSEMKFSSFEELEKQIKIDIEDGRKS